MKINDFFCGCGGFGLGFIQAGFEIVGAWDFDKYAVESYKHNIGDHVKQMSVLDMKGSDVPKANGWLFGFPCQDISVAGKQAGMIKGETRSGLFYEIMRLLGEVEEKPEWILAENVKAVNKFIPTIREEYEMAGYKMVDPRLYNTKFWFLPQNRERYFLLGIREDLVLDFQFPTEQKEFIPKLSSVLESEVDEKYYISDEKAAKIIEQAIDGLRIKEATKKGYATATEGDTINISHPNSKTRRGRVGKQVAQTLLTGTEQVVVQQIQSVFTDKDGAAYCCDANYFKGISPGDVGNGRRTQVVEFVEPKYRVRKLTQEEINNGYADERNTNQTLQTLQQDNGTQTVLERRINEPSSLQQTGLLQSGVYEEIVYEPQEKGNTMGEVAQNSNTTKESGSLRDMQFDEEHRYTSQGRKLAEQRTNEFNGSLQELPYEDSPKSEIRFRVRKLTPKEYQRLQGFPDTYEQVVSNSQFYKQMGNAVSVTVAHAIAKAIKEQFYV